jgi:solute carrier family 24 (sodium/potassium/calcium exchanger), member 6
MVVPYRTPNLQKKFRFRAFYITILCISFLAVVSLVADQSARYLHGAQFGAQQRRALEGLDITRLVKRVEEVSEDPPSIPTCSERVVV